MAAFFELSMFLGSRNAYLNRSPSSNSLPLSSYTMSIVFISTSSDRPQWWLSKQRKVGWR
ncbi:hypothetical protein Hanom_Chr16g01436371 [Helianthus anomalus]